MSVMYTRNVTIQLAPPGEQCELQGHVTYFLIEFQSH